MIFNYYFWGSLLFLGIESIRTAPNKTPKPKWQKKRQYDHSFPDPGIR